MNPSREFRVFCPPPGSRVVAISQYRWTRPFPESCSPEVARRVFEGALRIHDAITQHVESITLASVSESMKLEGFTFDVLLTDENIQLVEINVFGAMSGCGSCLFHWINDAQLLYGLEKEVEIRMTERSPAVADASNPLSYAAYGATAAECNK